MGKPSWVKKTGVYIGGPQLNSQAPDLFFEGQLLESQGTNKKSK